MGPKVNGTVNRAPTTAAMASCCHRLGAMVSGSLSMNPAKNSTGYEVTEVMNASPTSCPPDVRRTVRMARATSANTPPMASRPVR